ncbi:MAG: death-on-curing protein [Alphaproteobacteria bacterium RIFOXYD12_FULL_60_8]|nr:MAG: death-on-curing protein [Alphaproteobacteria bacterium RIFOXYD12_FULL_60_8]
MTAEPRWLTQDMVLAFHDESLAAFGGAAGVRDSGMLESAIDRPRNKYAYGETSFCVLAAAYGFGLVRNHPFVDGNKRTGLLAIAVFLGLNDHEFNPNEAEETKIILALAAGDLTEEALAAWVEINTHPSPQSQEKA